jgi:hypothetical protein
MERREAPGAWRKPLEGAPCDRGTQRADENGLARPASRRARPAATGLRGLPPGRCASRRSTATPHVAAPRSSLAIRRTGCGEERDRSSCECKCGLARGDNFFPGCEVSLPRARRRLKRDAAPGRGDAGGRVWTLLHCAPRSSGELSLFAHHPRQRTGTQSSGVMRLRTATAHPAPAGRNAVAVRR